MKASLAAATTAAQCWFLLAAGGILPSPAAAAFVPTRPSVRGNIASSVPYRRRMSVEESTQETTATATATTSTNSPVIVSPFDTSGNSDEGARSVASTTTKDEYLDLTWDNVELVLDGLRCYLIQDGGNVIISEIDGPVVKLELQGACGTCPSSTQTLKMGLERGLKEKIPEIQEVMQSMPQGPPLEQEQVDIVLDGVRPFLEVVGGSIDMDRIEGVDSLQPTIWLHMQGNSASLNSVKLEIAQRLQRHFMMSGLQIQWKE